MKPWSERVKEALDLTSRSDPAAVPKLVDLLFENPIPVSQPALPDDEVSKLLKFPGRSPQYEVEAVRVASSYQQWNRKCLQIVSQIHSALSKAPKCALKENILDMTIKAAGFELTIKNDSSHHSHLDDVCHLNMIASSEESLAAIEGLCKVVSPVTTNILHKVKGKKDIILKTGSCTSFSEETMSFDKEREMAKEELAKRGNPAYELKAYYVA